MVNAILQSISEIRKRIEADVGDKYNEYFDSLYNDIAKLSEQLPRKKTRDYFALAGKMIAVYKEHGCYGRKEFTNSQWVSAPAVIAKRLESKNIDITPYTDEEIIDATRRYIDVPDKRWKRTLPYFIWKDELPNGFKSDLLDYLENKDNDEVVIPQNDWLYGNQ